MKMDHNFFEGVCIKSEYELSEAWEAIERMFAVIVFDPDGQIIEVNKVFMDATGYNREELIGQHHRILCDKKYTESKDYVEFWNILRSGKRHYGTFRRVRKDGSDLFLYAEYTPILDDNGHVVKVLKIAQNTSRVAEHLIKKLGMSEQLIGRLLTMQ